MAVTLPAGFPATGWFQNLPQLAASRAPAGPGSDLGNLPPMQAFQALAPTILANQGQFARPEAARLLAGLTGAQTPNWAMTPAERAAAIAAAERARIPAPAPTPTPRPPVPNFPIGNTMFGNLGNIQALIQKYLAGRTGLPSSPPKATTAIAPGTSGPAPSAFANLAKFSGPFGNGGGGLDMGQLLSQFRGRVL